MSGEVTAWDDAANRTWDVLVIGAGPAGAVTALQSARQGLCTLLIEAKAFPRDKVCGGCLNARALQTLHRLGLDDVVTRCGSLAVRELDVVTGRQRLKLDLPAGATILRKTFDAEMVDAAVAEGVQFLPLTSAIVEPCVEAAEYRTVSVRGASFSGQLQARVVVAADGVLRSAVKHLPGMASRVAATSRLGMGAHFADDGQAYPAGRITMVVTRTGYVGLSRFEPGQLNAAAAVDPRSLRDGTSMAEAVTQILEQAGQPIPPNLASAAWVGTPLLSSQPDTVAAERLFLLGDAAGYVEPFTGEGMATALESAAAAAELIAAGARQWQPELAERWTRLHREVYLARRWICGSLALMLRNPWTVAASIQGCRWFPAVPRYLISRINRPSNWESGQTAFSATKAP